MNCAVILKWTQLFLQELHGAVHVDAVELNGVTFLLVERFDVESLPVPANARREETDATSARIVAQVLAFDAPVMGNIKLAPTCIVKDGNSAPLTSPRWNRQSASMPVILRG